MLAPKTPSNDSRRNTKSHSVLKILLILVVLNSESHRAWMFGSGDPEELPTYTLIVFKDNTILVFGHGGRHMRLGGRSSIPEML